MSKPRTRTIVRGWREGYVSLEGIPGPPARELEEAMEQTVGEILRWLETGDQDPDRGLRDAFRRLAHAFRAEGLGTAAALGAMTLLEDAFVEGDGAAEIQDPSRGARLRMGLRGMILDAVRMNMEMDARYSRERSDALEFFSEVLEHEIGNRLGAAKTAAELLRATELEVGPDRRDALLRLVSEGVQEALTSVSDVTALMSAHARDSGEPVPLKEVVDGVVRTVGPVARKEGVRIEAPEEVPTVLVDGPRMRLLLTNLTLNGVRYREPSRDDSWVRLHASAEDGRLELRVEDNGIGIDAADREEIFRYRERGTRGSEHSPDGSGLGLAVVAEAVAQMRGELGVESAVGEGSVFRLTVPAE